QARHDCDGVLHLLSRGDAGRRGREAGQQIWVGPGLKPPKRIPAQAAIRTTDEDDKMADAHAEKHHDYHLVNPSPWPFLASIGAFTTAIGLIVWMRSMGGGEGLFGLHGRWLFGVGVLALLAVAFMWWRDVIIEANSGDHTPVVQLHLRYGMILFIASEVMF